MRSRRRRASTGAAPPVETATITGARSTTLGMMALHSSCWSTTLQGMLAASAAWETRALRSASSVAATTKRQPLSAEAENSKPRCSTRGTNSGCSSRAMTATRAPARWSNSILRSATSPPPTTKTGWPCSLRKTGKYGQAGLFIGLFLPTAYEIAAWGM